MKGKVQDIAKYVITCSERIGKPISNLQLQPILYLLWKKYYFQTQQVLFDDDYFFAWKFAPVIPSVYYEYYMYGAYPINLNLMEKFDEEKIPISTRLFIFHWLKNNKHKNVKELVDKVCHPFSAWADTIKTRGIKSIIPFEAITDENLL